MIECTLLLLWLKPLIALTLQLTEQMDYLHFTVEIEIGQPPHTQTVKAIVDTGSGSLMVWNYPKDTSSTFTCGCTRPGNASLCNETGPKNTCEEFDFCTWKHPDGPCANQQNLITFACDKERILWNLLKSGTERMKFQQDPRGVYYDADIIYADFSDYVKSDYPIHKPDEIREFTDGVLGLTYNYTSIGQATSFWDMYGKGVPSTVALELNRGCGVEDHLRCEMHIDWIDDENYKIEWSDTDIIRKYLWGEDVVFHEFVLYDLAMCNTKLLSDDVTSVNVVIDTGSSCLTLPNTVFKLLTQLLSEKITCLSVSVGRPKTCFVKPYLLSSLPPLRFRLRPDSSTWHVISLSNLLFADVDAIAEGTVSDLELCLQEDNDDEMVFGTMALLNFYTVFDLDNQRVGLASKEKLTYTNQNSGKEVSCHSSLVTPCQTDRRFCTESPKSSSGSTDIAMVFATIMIVLAVGAVLALIFYIYRNQLWLHTRRTMGYRGMGEVSLITAGEGDAGVMDTEISTDPGSQYTYDPPKSKR